MRIEATQVYVHDQDEALAFYTDKLGWEVRTDATMPQMGGFRWLTVGPPGQPDLELVLMAVPGPPVADEDTGEQMRGLMAKGVGGAIYLSTDDCRATCAELEERGVEFVQPPEEQPYGIVSAFHDPSGNYIRLSQARVRA